MIKLVVISAVLLVSAICTGAAAMKPLYVDPACPKPGEAITLRALPNPAQIPIGPIAVSSNGSAFTLVLPTGENGFDAPVGSIPIDIGSLSLGTYTVQFYVRQTQPSGALGPEELVATTMFTVQDNPPACEARYVVPLTYEVVTGLLGQPYSSVSGQVVDAHGFPVAGVGVYWQRLMLTNGVAPLYLLFPPYFTATGPSIPEGYGPDAVVMCAPA